MKLITKKIYFELIAISLGFFLSFICFLPAFLLAKYVSLLSNGNISLINYSGTVWNGSSNIIINSKFKDGNSFLIPSRVNWMASLSFKGIDIKLEAECCFPRGIDLRVLYKKIMIKNGSANFPLEILNLIFPILNNYSVTGILSFDWRNLIFNLEDTNYLFQGDINILAKNVSTSITNIPELGSYKLALKNKNNYLNLNIETLEGPLNLEGAGGWKKKRFFFDGYATNNEIYSQNLNALLSLVGKRDGEKTRIRFGEL